MNNTMTYKNYSAQIMEANRLVGDKVHGLPPGSALPVYHVDEFVKVPETWMKGPGVFVVPVRPNKGLWFNFRMNDEANTAVILTVKGANPITGLPTSGFHLERYDDKCPKHGCAFMADRFCPECNYKWPDRGYLSGSPLWWDGFRSDDGTVRQFFFTEEELRDVASAMIGKENTVPAFGFAFYSSKVPRALVPRTTRGVINMPIIQMDGSHDYTVKYMNNINVGASNCYLNSTMNSSLNEVKTSGTVPICASGSSMSYSAEGINTISAAEFEKKLGMNLCCDSIGPSASASVDSDDISAIVEENKEYSLDSATLNFMAPLQEAPKSAEGPKIIEKLLRTSEGRKKLSKSMKQPMRTRRDYKPEEEARSLKDVAVSVGAGAKISQALPGDTLAVDTWKDAPDATMTIYFVFQETFEKMRDEGMRDFSGVKEGMLAGIPVG
jgi:hypothetical protein